MQPQPIQFVLNWQIQHPTMPVTQSDLYQELNITREHFEIFMKKMKMEIEQQSGNKSGINKDYMKSDVECRI